MSTGQQSAGALALLRLVHTRPGIARSDAARSLGMSTSTATEITARLRERRLLAEIAPAASARRGRPSGLLVASTVGPVVCAVEISHSRWRVAAVEIGGRVVSSVAERRPREAAATLVAARTALEELHRSLGPRIGAVGLTVSGTVSGSRLMQAATLRWRDVDLSQVVPPTLRGVPFVAGNDATLAGLAEARRGAAAGVGEVLYLAVEVGVGGILVVDGQPLTGARGEGGEFGHIPLGDPALRCPCGAVGCWDLEVDGRALARALGRRAPADPRAFAATVVAAAREGAAPEATAVARVAAALGRGTGALVNALDPDLVVYGGLAPDLRAAAPVELERAYRAALMRHRRADPPAIATSALGDDASLVGASELAFDLVLTPSLLGDGPSR
jgi:predicted NBD/HSP70 family sugar kinase